MIRLSNTRTFGNDTSVSSCFKASFSVGGLGGVMRFCKSFSVVFEELITLSGILAPVNCIVRLTTYKAISKRPIA